MTLLALDIGTSRLSALAFSSKTSDPLAVRGVPNDAGIADLPPGRHEQDPGGILQRSLDLFRELLGDAAVEAADVKAIAVTGQMHGVLLIDGENRPLTNLITWLDRRVLETGEPGHLNLSRFAMDIASQRRLGCRMHAGYGGALLHWLEKNGQVPDYATAVSAPGFVAASLSGLVASDPTLAASWGLMDIVEETWDAKTLKRLGLDEHLLPPIRPSGSPLGPLLPERAQPLGLGDGVEVCVPLGDNQASVLGAAGFAGDAGVVNVGTGGQVSLPVQGAAFAPGLETRPMPFGGYLLVRASLRAGGAYQILARFFRRAAEAFTGSPVGEDETFAALNALAENAPSGAEGLRADTRFAGTWTDPDVRAAFSGIGEENFTPANVARSALEGVARELAEAGELSGLPEMKKIVAAGNAVRMIPPMLSILEEQFGIPCEPAPHAEEAALGAALCASVQMEKVAADKG